MRNNVSPLDAKKSIHPGDAATKTVSQLSGRSQCHAPCEEEMAVLSEMRWNIVVYRARDAVLLGLTELMPPFSNFTGEIHEE